MPCYERERQRFEVWKTNVQTQSSSGGSFNTKKQREDEAAEFFARLKQKRDDHLKALSELRRKLKEATSEYEKDRLRKEIDDLEDEIGGFEDTMEQLVEFMRDMERRTVNIPGSD